jgi:hypothetical protein
MNRKLKAVVAPPVEVSLEDLFPTAPTTTEGRLLHVRVLGQKIDGYIHFMCALSRLNGSSAETKHKAVAVFHERLAAMEKELGRIQEELRLA